MAGIEGALRDAMGIDGAVGVALVDATSGMALGTLGEASGLDLQVAAAGATDVVRAQQRAADALGLLGEKLEDSLTTLTRQYHLVRPLTSPGGKGLFLYLVLERTRANLAMARHQVRRIDEELVV
ncbi:hypothetical protein PUR71_10165 [Streptomyces sp. SP17BM10]|uniref:hypothetical protein n=1 Tax=Streptomyces sp. SP17BM10 TaxID=3002530 RepID=UPI002E76A0E3|nr:hypothetical protein [Streptomyces sp. SP17BM10]MEE1783275.1 hypothetical protein [Streptomyces sp. SP17BM10]